MTEFNPFEPGQAQTAWPLLAELRAEGPVASIAGGMRYVARHAECLHALRDTTSLSNASGMKAPGVDVPFEDRILGELDPPQHSAVRRVMVTALTPKVVRAAEHFMRDAAFQLLRRIPVPGTADLVSEFTVPLPNLVTVHLLGFPPEDAGDLARWAKGLMESEFPRMNRTERGEGFAGAFPEFAGYIDDKIAERVDEIEHEREVPDDVLTRLIRLDMEGETLNRRQLRALVRNLITGGLTTTSQLLGNLLHAVLADPELETRLRRDATALNPAIEESLRLAPPILFVARACTHATAIAETEIAEGERVVVGIGSANRDEQLFEHGDEFDLDRVNVDQHLTFGFGPHVCPGATLARVEARVALTAFLDHFTHGAVSLEPGFEFENVTTFFEIGPRRLPVVTTDE